MAAAALMACAGAVLGYHAARTGPVAVDLAAIPAGAGVQAPDLVAAQCGALVDHLPSSLEGRDRRHVVAAKPAHSPVADDRRAAVWGSPATVLKCGVAEPGEITVGGPDYDPLHNQLVAVDGVNWIVQDQRQDSVRFTTTDRAAYIEVTVPGDPAHATDVLVDLAPTVIATVPAKDGSGLVPDKS